MCKDFIHGMIRVFLRGGLGNQLFQYTAGVFIGRKQGTNVLFRTDLLPAEADSIGLVSRWPSQLSEFRSEGSVSKLKHQPPGSTHLLSKFMHVLGVFADVFPKLFLALGVLAGQRQFQPSIFQTKNIRLVDSYCSSSIPALYLGEELRDQIRDINAPSEDFLALVQEAQRERPTIVHVRLGDYQNLKHLYGEPQYESISKVIDLCHRSNKSRVWVFTDSPTLISQQVMAKLGADKVIGPENLKRPIENLVLMSMGATLICSNSTFSWWSAFLMGKNGTVFYPKGRGLPHEIFSKDMVIEGWNSF